MRITRVRQAIAAVPAHNTRGRRRFLILSARWRRSLNSRRGTRFAHYSGMNSKLTAGAWIPALLLPAWAAAQVQAPASIQKVAEDFLATHLAAPQDGKVFVSADALDPRLRLKPCASQPTGLLPPGARIGARATVGVRCTEPKWTVYVPVRVETELPVLVLRRALDRNSPLAETDVERTTRRVPGLSSSYIGSIAQLAGRHLKRESMPGTPLTVDLLTEDVLVRHGQRVTLVASAGGLEVRAPGEAITDAGPDGRVRVLNLDSRRIVEGQVETRDVVRVSL
jgi:flagella basal body P-ring formation protein FlgA